MEETLKNSNFSMKKLLKFCKNHQYRSYLDKRWKQLQNYKQKNIQYQQLHSLIMSQYLKDECKIYNSNKTFSGKKNLSNLSILKTNNETLKQNIYEKPTQISNIFNFYEKNQSKKFKVGFSTKQGHFLKNNQDSIFLDNNLFILCDGHGKNGQQISILISNFLYQSFQYVFTKKILTSIKQINKLLILSYIRQIFKQAEVQLKKSKLSLKSSGTTSLVLQILDNYIICANCGNTKAILIKNTKIIQLTQQETCGFQRQQIYNKIMKNQKKVQYQSSRSQTKRCTRKFSNFFNQFEGFGTTINQVYQIEKKPYINFYQRSCQDQFIIMGTNSLFQFIPKETMMAICKKMLKNGKSVSDIATHLTNEAKLRWKTIQHEDISCIFINIKQN